MKRYRLIITLFFFCVPGFTQAQQSAVPQIPTPAPSAGDAQFAHARQLLQQGKYDEAIAELQQLASAQPGTKGLLHELGIAYYRKGDYVHAIESLKQALQSDPADNEATQLLGLSFYLCGKR